MSESEKSLASTETQDEPQPSSEPTHSTPAPLEPEKEVSEILFWLNIDGSFIIDYRLLIGSN